MGGGESEPEQVCLPVAHTDSATRAPEKEGMSLASDELAGLTHLKSIFFVIFGDQRRHAMAQSKCQSLNADSSSIIWLHIRG